MAITAGLCVLLLAALTALATPAILRGLPTPPEDSPPPPFSELLSPRFQQQVFGLVILAGVIVIATTPATLWPVWVPLVALGPLLGMIDAHTLFLPLRLHYLTLLATIVGAAVTAWLSGSTERLWPAAIAAILVTGLYAALWRLSRGQFGFGDVRLAGLLAFASGMTGLRVLAATFICGALIGAGWSVAATLRRRARTATPYGPAMLLGAPLGLMITALWPFG